MKRLRMLVLSVGFSLLLAFATGCGSSADVSPPVENPTVSPTPVSTPAGTPTPTPSPAPVITPPYVAHIAVMDETGWIVGFANAVLVDDVEGFFVTNAHVIATGETFLLILGSQVYEQVETEEEWINWEADLALVKIDVAQVTSPLPKPPSFVEPPSVGSSVTVSGYVVDPAQMHKLPTSYYSVAARIESIQSWWGITLGAAVDVLVVSRQFEARMKVPKEDWHLLYTNYIELKRLRYGGENDGFREGLSGSPVLTEDGNVIGILSGANEGAGVAVPAKEIKALLEKVKGSMARHAALHLGVQPQKCSVLYADQQK